MTPHPAAAIVPGGAPQRYTGVAIVG